MDLENRFIVNAPLDAAWTGLLDIPLVVECLPGATLTATLDPTNYTGTMRVRLGPMAMEFAGKLRLEAVDHTAHHAVVKATWNETRNRGSATSVSTLEATPNATGTEVQVKTTVTLAGQIAQYGRGVGVIQAVAGELVKQFAANLQARLGERQLQPAPDDCAPPETPARAQTPKEISSFALIWAAFTTWWRGLLARH